MPTVGLALEVEGESGSETTSYTSSATIDVAAGGVIVVCAVADTAAGSLAPTDATISFSGAGSSLVEMGGGVTSTGNDGDPVVGIWAFYNPTPNAISGVSVTMNWGVTMVGACWTVHSCTNALAGARGVRQQLGVDVNLDATKPAVTLSNPVSSSSAVIFAYATETVFASATPKSGWTEEYESGAFGFTTGGGGTIYRTGTTDNAPHVQLSESETWVARAIEIGAKATVGVGLAA